MTEAGALVLDLTLDLANCSLIESGTIVETTAF